MKHKNLLTFYILFLGLLYGIEPLPFSGFTKCGVNQFKIELGKPRVVKPSVGKAEFKRRLADVDEDGFREFYLYYDPTNLEEEIEQYNLQSLHDLFVNALDKVVKTLKSLLKVQPCKTNFQFFDEDMKNIGINHWDKTKFGNQTYEKNIGLMNLDIDLVVFVRFWGIDEMGSAIASGAPWIVDPGLNGRPFSGIININRDVDYSLPNSRDYLESVILHEFIHVLGFHPRIFDTYHRKFFYYIKDGTKYHHYLNSTKLVEVARKYYNCSSLKAIELEDDGGFGSAGGHFEARILLGENMNGIIHPEEQVLSEFTLALLEDTGYYKANYYTGGLMQYGRNKGCEFLTDDCIDPQTNKTNPKFKNEFWDNIYNKESKADPSCSSGRQSRTYNYRTFKSAANCPIALNPNEEIDPDFDDNIQNQNYEGHCSAKGTGKYGKFIYYKDENNEPVSYEASQIAKITGEANSPNSFCALSSLAKFTEFNYKQFSSTVRAVCLQMHCSDRSLTIQLGYDYIVCPRAGGKIGAVGYDGFLLCPDYNLICSATVLCNEMFDCVEKKSVLKEDSYYYDYESKTHQDIQDALKEKLSQDNYELSTNGKCPQNCCQCNERNQCMKCREGYQIDSNKKCSK